MRAAALVLAAVLVACLPLAAGRMPPVFDLPNHLARVDAIVRFASDPDLQQFYELSSFALPNVLSDLVLVALMQVESPDLAGKHLIAATFALAIGGIAFLGAAAGGRPSPWFLLSGIFVTNEMFFWGFLNYNLGLALLPWGLGIWIAGEGRATPASRTLIGAAFAILIFFAHFVAFALYAVGIGLIELREAWLRRAEGFGAATRRLAIGTLQFAPALIIYGLISPSASLPLDLRFDFSIWGKLSPFARVLSSGNPAMDTPMLLGLVLFAALALVTGRARLHGGLALVAVAYAMLVLVLPYSALGSFFLDSRIAIASVFLFAAAMQPPRRGTSGQSAIVLVLLGVLAFRSIYLLADWREQESILETVREDLKVLPERSVLIAGSARPFELGDWRTTRTVRPAHEHTAAYAAIDRHAIVPTLFARRGQNPLVFEPDNRSMEALARNPLPRLFSDDDFRRFIAPALEAADTQPRRRIYAVAFHASCAQWPGGLPVRFVVCRPDYSLVEVQPRANTAAAAGATP